MKFLKIVLMFVLVALIANCKSDDDSVNFVLNNANIAGTYSVTLFNSTSVETQDINGLTVEARSLGTCRTHWKSEGVKEIYLR